MKSKLLCLALSVLAASASAAAFQQAVPCWPETGGDDLNRVVGFRVVLDTLPADAVLRVAASGLYLAAIDGQFIGHGPVRAGHGHFRIDEWPLKNFRGQGKRVIGIKVAASTARSYYMVKKPPFLQAEIVSGNKVLANSVRISAFVASGEVLKNSRQPPFPFPDRLPSVFSSLVEKANS